MIFLALIARSNAKGRVITAKGRGHTSAKGRGHTRPPPAPSRRWQYPARTRVGVIAKMYPRQSSPHRQTDRPVPALRPPSCSQCWHPGNKPIDVFNTKLCEIFIVSRHFYWFHLHIGITSSANGASWATEPVRSSDKQHNQTWLILQTAFQRPSLQEHRVSCNHHCTGSVVHSVQLSTSELTSG